MNLHTVLVEIYMFSYYPLFTQDVPIHNVSISTIIVQQH